MPIYIDNYKKLERVNHKLTIELSIAIVIYSSSDKEIEDQPIIIRELHKGGIMSDSKQFSIYLSIK